MNDDEARTKPVLEGCVWCKKPKKDAGDGVKFVPVGDQEKICTVCLSDLRWYKRVVSWQFSLDTDLDETFKNDAFDAVAEAFNGVLREHGVEDLDTMDHEQTRSNAEGFGEYRGEN